jgi:hypothetical protein
MTTPTIAREALLSRLQLTSPPELADPTGPGERARAVVAAVTATATLVVENAVRGRTVDGWLTDDELVWHLRGDDTTPRTAVVAPRPHLSSTVAAMVGLGPRTAGATADLAVPTADLPGLVAGTATQPGLGRLRTAWSLAVGDDGCTVLDEGPRGRLWAVAGADADRTLLRPVSPLEVWLRLARIGRSAG